MTWFDKYAHILHIFWNANLPPLFPLFYTVIAAAIGSHFILHCMETSLLPLHDIRKPHFGKCLISYEGSVMILNSCNYYYVYALEQTQCDNAWECGSLYFFIFFLVFFKGPGMFIVQPWAGCLSPQKCQAQWSIWGRLSLSFSPLVDLCRFTGQPASSPTSLLTTTDFHCWPAHDL